MQSLLSNGAILSRYLIEVIQHCRTHRFSSVHKYDHPNFIRASKDAFQVLYAEGRRLYGDGVSCEEDESEYHLLRDLRPADSTPISNDFDRLQIARWRFADFCPRRSTRHGGARYWIGRMIRSDPELIKTIEANGYYFLPDIQNEM